MDAPKKPTAKSSNLSLLLFGIRSKLAFQPDITVGSSSLTKQLFVESKEDGGVGGVTRVEIASLLIVCVVNDDANPRCMTEDHIP